jgi:hypothetical protein
MPITKTITEQHTRTVTLMTLQEYADQSVAEQYRQPLKTIHEALSIHGWDANPFPEDYKPVCCGSEVSIRSFLGGPYFVQCESCKRFLVDVTGPSFGNSWISLPDGDKIDLETDVEHRWIAGQELPATEPTKSLAREGE